VNLRKIFGRRDADTSTLNPYLNGRRSWNNHVGGIIQQGFLGTLFGVLGMMIALAAVGGLIHIGSKSKFIPLVFERDSTGNSISLTRADRMQAAKVEDYRAAAADFINNVRLVTPDVALQRKAVFKSYAFLVPSDAAFVKANEYLNGTKESSPFARAATETVSVEIKSVLQQSPESWQVDWEETVRSRDGAPKSKPYTMRALVTMYQGETTPDTTEDQLLLNTHLIFVRDYNWSKLK